MRHDKLGQLAREDDKAAGENGATWTYTYDNRGNISSKKRYAYAPNTSPGTALETINYTYKTTGWKDILTGVGGVTYSNDTIGNRTSYGTWSYTWEHGRQLAGMTKSGTSIAYDYGADGYRISKAVTEGGTTTTYNYFYSGGKLLHVSWNASDRVHIFYNAGGSPISILYNGTRYYYVKNVQGDIVGLTTTSSLLRVAYTYDAWGNPLTTTGSMAGTLGKVNPLRYRGYVYDEETGLYYLGSRYYDPGVGRFINADAYVSTGQGFIGNNMFAYCGNNPIELKDSKGLFWEELWETLVQTFQQARGFFTAAAAISQLDSPIPGPADVISGTLIFGGALVCLGIGVYKTISSQSTSRTISKAKEIAKDKTRQNDSTEIYRYGGTNPGNLTPRKKDLYTGLSFSTTPLPGAAKTTIGEINSTGVLYAIQDGDTHVSVRPVNATIEEWIREGSGSIWTQTLKSVVIKWDGGQ